MKKRKFSLFCLVLLIGFLIINANAQETNLPVGEQDVQNIQDAVGKIPINPETGEIDQAKLNSYKSRIDKIMEYVNKAVWLKYVFGMRPELTWLFLINFIVILTFLNILVFNGNKLLLFVSDASARLIGLALVIILIETHFIINTIAKPLSYLFKSWFIIVMIILAIVLLNAFFSQIMKLIKSSKEKREKQKEVINREALNKLVQSAEDNERTTKDEFYVASKKQAAVKQMSQQQGSQATLKAAKDFWG